MSDRDRKAPEAGKGEANTGRRAERRAREAGALRANLRRRKDQARARAADGPPAGAGPDKS